MFSLDLTKEILLKYLNILPISYYLGRKIRLGITDEDFSYCNNRNNTIMISIPQLNSLTYQEKPTIDVVERDIRCMLYHETSHALLTPIEDVTIKHSIFNIFEDERIETLLGDYYLDVDFKDFVKRINHFDPTKPPRNEMDYFYRVVRFRFGEKSLVDRVSKIIYDARFINANVTRGNNNYSFNDYLNDINKLFEDCKSYFLDHYEVLEEYVEEKVIRITIRNVDKDKSKSRLDKDMKMGKKDSLKDLAKVLGISVDNVLDAVGSALSSVLGKQKESFDYIEGKCSKDFKNRVEEIIQRLKPDRRKPAKAISTYSGRISPRLTINNDYKWFLRDQKGEHSGFSNKLHLNLFIDVSGSFSANTGLVNSMLEVLDGLEKEAGDKFFYKLITMGGTIRIVEGKRRITCAGGTRLSEDWKETYDKVQDKKNKTINIVLFDGSCYDYLNMHVFSMFNNCETIIISDSGNEIPISRYCPNAKEVIIVDDGNYVGHLEENILNTLTRSIR